MKKLLLGFVATAAFVIAICTDAAPQQQQTVLTVTINSNGQPLSDVEVVLELANKNKVASATTGGDGTASLDMSALDIANMGKVQVEVVVDQDCSDGKTHVALTAAGQQPDDNGCKKTKKVFAFTVDGSRRLHLIVDVALGTATLAPASQPAAAATTSAASAAQANPVETTRRWDVSVSGFGGASVLNFSPNNPHPLPLLGGEFGLDYKLPKGFGLGFSAGLKYAHSTLVQKFGGTETGETFASTYAGQTEIPFGMRVDLPEIHNLRLDLEADALPTFSRTHIVEGSCGTSGCTSSPFELDKTLWGYSYGARISYPVCPPMSSRLRIFAGYNRNGSLKYTSGSLINDFQSNEGYGGIEFDW